MVFNYYFLFCEKGLGLENQYRLERSAGFTVGKSSVYVCKIVLLHQLIEWEQPSLIEQDQLGDESLWNRVTLHNRADLDAGQQQGSDVNKPDMPTAPVPKITMLLPASGFSTFRTAPAPV